jgi:hypothetical protein
MEEKAVGELDTRRSSVAEVLLIFLRLGLTSFGGPIAHLGYFHDEFVVRRRWLQEKTPISSRSVSSCLGRRAARSVSPSGSPARATRERSRLGSGSRCPRLSHWCCLPMASGR